LSISLGLKIIIENFLDSREPTRYVENFLEFLETNKERIKRHKKSLWSNPEANSLER